MPTVGEKGLRRRLRSGRGDAGEGVFAEGLGDVSGLPRSRGEPESPVVVADPDPEEEVAEPSLIRRGFRHHGVPDGCLSSAPAAQQPGITSFSSPPATQPAPFSPRAKFQGSNSPSRSSLPGRFFAGRPISVLPVPIIPANGNENLGNLERRARALYLEAPVSMFRKRRALEIISRDGTRVSITSGLRVPRERSRRPSPRRARAGTRSVNQTEIGAKSDLSAPPLRSSLRRPRRAPSPSFTFGTLALSYRRAFRAREISRGI